ncbi:hypothetical protein KJ912_03190, partial [Patescibacteria group bacterium]|nr:hypothetical protein [Patescibacteria group bacterium]
MLRYGQLTSWFSKMKNKNKFHGWIFFKILLLFIMAGGFVFLAWDAKIRRGLEPGAEIEDSRLLEMKNRFENAQEQEAFPRMIPESKKREMLDCGYARLDAYFPPEPSSGIGAARTGEAGRSACELSADNGLDFEYDRLEVVIIADGKIKGRGGSGRGDILKDIELAVDLAVKDKEFGGALTSQGKDQAELLYSFSYNRRELKDMGRQWLEAEIEPGLHTLGINKQGKETFLEALTFARKNYSARQGLKELCRRVESSEDCRENKQTAFYLYDEFAFKGGRQGKTGDLFRYNILVEDKDIDSDFLLKRLESARNWYLETVNRETGRLEYLYFPDKDSYSAGNNQVRQLAVLWSMAELDKFLEKEKGGDYASRPEFKKLIANTFDHYLKFAKEDQEKYYLEIQGQAKLAYNAFLVMALLNSPDYPGARGYMNKLAQGIVKQQKKDGSFATHFNSSENSGVDFYPGEAMLALMKAYQETGNKLYLDSVKKAFPYYRDYWRDNKETAFIPWHSQADYLLF